MSFILKSIELKNIRAHEHFLFEPALEGITAISGDNGAGKSTIVDSFAWCLYGTRPSGIKNRNLIRDGVNPKDKPVSVKAIISIGGVDYAIERKIITAAGATECNVWGRKQGTKEYTQVAGPAVTHVEKFIRSELGMNEKGFLTSILIQQKQVDQIVSATPRERGAVIEELTGIASVTHAITKMNENTRSLEKAASLFRTGNIDEATEKVENQEKICLEMERKEKDALIKFQEMKVKFSEMKSQLDIQEVKVAERRKLEQEIEAHKRNVEFLRKQSTEDLEYIENFKETHGSTIAIDPSELKIQLDAKRSEIYHYKNEERRLEKEIKESKEDIEKIQIIKKDYKTKKAVNEEIKESESLLNNLEKKLEELKSNKTFYLSEVKHSKDSYEHISGEEETCPVCKSDIEDPKTLKEEILREIENFKSKHDEVVLEIKNVESNIQEESSKLKELNVILVAISEELNLKRKIKEDESKIKEIQTKRNLLDGDLASLESEYDKALTIEADKKALEAAKRRSLTVNETIEENNREIKKKESLLKELDALNDRSYNALVNKVNEAKDRISRMSLAGKEINGRKKLELERLKDYKSNLEEVEEAMRKYNEISEQIEISASASAMLTAFKADRIENAIPTLEFFASDFLSKFTGGAFTKLSVDEKFNTFVTTSEGVVRPVAQLSGGELSAASIALRLGIAMLLNSSDKNVLILDEVLVSMDEDRSRQIMETIGSMTNSQVIFIAHNSDINSVADKTVLVTK